MIARLRPRPAGGWLPGSIKARLLLSLLATLAVVALAIGGLTYRSVLRETEALFDYQLRQMALSLRDQGEVNPADAAALNDEDLDFVVQIWRVDGRSVYASRLHRTLPTPAVLGLAEVRVDGERWRSFGVAARDRVIQVAQPVRIRQGLAADAALRALAPLAVAAPLLALAMGWLIDRSLRPLARVARQVREQDAAALAPLPADGLPDEVAPLVRSLNALLDRLSLAWAGQRAFVADAAHELRSPLTALKLQVQVLRRLLATPLPEAAAPADAARPPADAAGDDPAARRREALDALAAGVDRAARLVEQLLALARSEPGAGGDAAAPLAPVALAPLLRQVLADSAAALAAQRGTRLTLDADEAVQVPGDAAALAVLVRNLVDNALRYTPPGGQVALTLAATPRGARLTVDDDGPGIPEAERARVFERFVRGSTAADTAGSGLGLAIVQAIARRHGAQVTLDSAPQGGLRVQLDFAMAAGA